VDERLSSETERVRAAAARVVARADEKRGEIERALHDGVQQDLVALAVKLQLLRIALESEPTGVEQLLGELERDVQGALDRVRALSETVYPASLETRGLRESLLAAAAALDVSARIDADGLERYPAHIERAVYFCGREALTQTATPTLRIWEESDALWFEVTGESDALPELVDRVDTLGGSVSAVGSMVRASIPLA
jgi:signal transduction histidine kinase